MKRLALLLGIALVFCFGFVACGDDDDGDEAPQLTTAHNGYDRADCASCHTLANIHGGSREWTQCFGCHGDNGQPSRPAGHSSTGCIDCHDGVMSAPWNGTTHADYAAYTASQCLGCHD